jgi:hypothetical protein
MSPYATIVCIASANAADADFVSLLSVIADLLRHHRGITHSIIGTIALISNPDARVCVERAGARWAAKSGIRFGGLLRFDDGGGDASGVGLDQQLRVRHYCPGTDVGSMAIWLT